MKIQITTQKPDEIKRFFSAAPLSFFQKVTVKKLLIVEQILKRMKALGLNRSKLAARMEISPARVTAVLRPTNPVHIFTAIGIQLLCSTLEVTAAPGDLDISFGIGGVAVARIDYTTGNGEKSDRIEDLLVQPDGKIVAVGSTVFTYRNSAIARFNPDGCLDPSFGSEGKNPAGIGSWNDEALAVALQSDGKIVVAGYVSTPGNGTSFSVSRLNQNGFFDESFSGDGVAELHRRTSATNETAYALGIQPSGKILVAGTSSEGSSFMYSAVARLNEDGTLDNTFRGAGKFSEYNRQPKAMHILPDGKFLLAGSYRPDYYEFRHWVARYSVNGVLEAETITSTAAPRGSGNTQDYGSVAESVKVDPNGDIWTAGIGIGGESNVLIRYSSGLGSGTITSTPSDIGGMMAIQPNGKLLVLGGSLARFAPAPQLDTTFSGDGIVELPNELRNPKAIACQGNGSVLVGGESSLGYFSLTRILTDGNPPTDVIATPSSIGENIAAGAMVGTLAAVDADVGDSFQYSLAAGLGDNDNVRFTIIGNQVFTAAVLDFEEGETRSIRVRVIDSTQGILEKPVAITLIDDLSEDIDGDGLNQAQEKFYHSSDLSTDSDGDGLGDYAEVHTYGSRPGSADSDGDGIGDNDELARGTGIINSDSDGDGLNDGDEIVRAANPLLPDTDGDGFLDGYEVQTGKSPTDPLDKPALVAEARTAIEFTFSSAIGKIYNIEGSPDMTTWESVEDGIAGTGTIITRFYTTRNLPKKFLRVEEHSQP